jgi:WD40 repeat protein
VAFFFRTGLTLAATDTNGARLWDLTDPGQPRPLGQPFGAPLDGVTISADGSILAASNGDNNSTTLWDLTDRARPQSLGRPLDTGFVFSMSFSADGRSIALEGQENTIVLRELTRLNELRRNPSSSACIRAGAALDPTLWNNYAPGFDYINSC